MSDSTVVLEVIQPEIVHLGLLVDQFLELLADESPLGADEAVERLTPNPYPEDAEAAREFHSYTRSDLLRRREEEARIVLGTLRQDGIAEEAAGDEDAAPRPLQLTSTEASAWMRTLVALRLVLASRLQITDDAYPHPEDPRYGIYEWLGYRLDNLLEQLAA